MLTLYTLKTNMRKLTNQFGFHVLELCIVLLMVSAVSVIGWRVIAVKAQKKAVLSEQSTQYRYGVNSVQTFDTEMYDSNIWSSDHDQWVSSTQNPPDCPQPFQIHMPVSVDSVTSVLVPGQNRKGSYNSQSSHYAHSGGLRFDTSNHSDIQVSSPIDGYISRASVYTVDTEVQYAFEIYHPCGRLITIDHIRSLTEKFEEIIAPITPVTDQPKLVDVEPTLVKAGELIATAVGLELADATFIEIGYYDLTAINPAANSREFRHVHQGDALYSWHGLCWLESLPAASIIKLRELPAADTDQGKTSDYCSMP